MRWPLGSSHRRQPLQEPQAAAAGRSCRPQLNAHLQHPHTSLLPGFMPYTKIAPERLKVGHQGDLGYLVGEKVSGRPTVTPRQGSCGHWHA